MKFSRSLTVLASSTILAAGAVVAVNAVTVTNPIKLCANTKTGFVSVPSASGSCPKGTADTLVANDADVRALAQRMEGVEATGLALQQRITSLEAKHREHGSATYSLVARAEELLDGPVAEFWETPRGDRIYGTCENAPRGEDPLLSMDRVAVGPTRLTPRDRPGDDAFGYTFQGIHDQRTLVFYRDQIDPDLAGLTVTAARSRENGHCIMTVTISW